MNWDVLHEATSEAETPTPGWIFRELIQDARRHPMELPEVAEYLMRCAACDSPTVALKACLALRHLADDIPEFRQYMQRCPEALEILREMAAPPPLAITASLERPEAKVAREVAARALASCTAPVSYERAAHQEQVKQRIQGFGNFEPPPREEEAEPQNVVDKVASFVGDAVGDTIDDFREKGAVGAVRDGIADAADLIMDGVGAVWDFLGGRRGRESADEPRICQPIGGAGACRVGSVGFPTLSGSAFGMPGAAGAPFAFPAASPPAPAPASAAAAFHGAFGRGAVGAGHAFHPALLEAAAAEAGRCDGGSSGGHAAVAAAPPLIAAAAPGGASGAPAATSRPPAPPEDLLSFDEPLPVGAPPPADLLGGADCT